MADAAIDVYHDQFINLANGSTATMLVLPIALGLTKGAILTINEVDSSDVPTGLYGTGVVTAIASGEFYNLPVGYNQYYLNPLNMFPWIDYSSLTTINGFSSTTQAYVWYCVIGSTLYWYCGIDGTSNSNSLTFTLPYVSAGQMGAYMSAARVNNNGTGLAGAGMCLINNGSNIVNCRSTLTNAAWATANRKFCYASGFYPI